ncbi:MAG: hypothetical protein HQL53_04100 [Magnetococcales bacterium]|nr:hypothetical protein [Magnetococcales bacterium]
MLNRFSHNWPRAGILLFLTLLLSGCATDGFPTMEAGDLPPPSSLKAPPPIDDTSGRFLSPYMSYGDLSDWADQLSKLAKTESGTETKEAAEEESDDLMSFLGGLSEQPEASTTPSSPALMIENIGGMAFISSSSDQSYATLEAMAVHLYAKHSGDIRYKDALNAAQMLYPDLQAVYAEAIKNAPRRVQAQNPDSGDMDDQTVKDLVEEIDGVDPEIEMDLGDDDGGWEIEP